MAQQKAEVRGAMNLVKLIEQYGDEERARACLEALRWPNGVRCPRCDSDKISRVKKRGQFDCDSCRYQFSVKAGTVFHDSHLPLWKWFLATYLMCESKKGISANQLKRTLAVSYKTAWYLCHRIRSAMDEATPEALFGVVEADETYIGSRTDTKKNPHDYREKMMVMGALERGGAIRLRVGKGGPTAKNLKGFVRDTIIEDSKVYTDGHPGYRGLKGYDHEVVDHTEEEWVRGDVSTQGIESAWSLLKRSIVGSYHQLSAKHLQAYMDEFAFRFNNRENPFLFRDTLCALLAGEALTYQALTVGNVP